MLFVIDSCADSFIRFIISHGIKKSRLDYSNTHAQQETEKHSQNMKQCCALQSNPNPQVAMKKMKLAMKMNALPILLVMC